MGNVGQERRMGKKVDIILFRSTSSSISSKAISPSLWITVSEDTTTNARSCEHKHNKDNKGVKDREPQEREVQIMK